MIHMALWLVSALVLLFIAVRILDLLLAGIFFALRGFGSISTVFLRWDDRQFAKRMERRRQTLGYS